MNYFTILKLILFIKGFQDNFINTMNFRHFVVLFLLPFTESAYRSCIFLSVKAFLFLRWDFGSLQHIVLLHGT